MSKYHFSVMAGKKAPYALIEGARGCNHQCTFCTQWRHWQGCWRLKPAKRIADEMAYCNREFGSQMIWLTDDNFGSGERPLAKWLKKSSAKHLPDDVSWFVQARCDDIIRNKDLLPRLSKSGLRWVLLGVENSSPTKIALFRKASRQTMQKRRLGCFQDNGIIVPRHAYHWKPQSNPPIHP